MQVQEGERRLEKMRNHEVSGQAGFRHVPEQEWSPGGGEGVEKGGGSLLFRSSFSYIPSVLGGEINK